MKNNNKGGLFGICLLIGFIIVYWQWILGFILLALALWGAYVGTKAAVRGHRARVAAERANNAALSARADEQHQQYLAGEDHGLYGDYQPARLD